MLLNDSNNGRTYNGENWAFQIKTLLNSLGFSYVWDNQDTLESIPFREIKQRILDQVNQDLLRSLNTSTKLQSYCIFKENTDHESYLDFVRPNKFKYALSKFRLSSHSLEIETGRYYDISRKDRLCTCCNMYVVESEFHFLLVSPAYHDIRRKYLTSYFCRWPTLNKFKLLMQNGKEKHTKKSIKIFIFCRYKEKSTEKNKNVKCLLFIIRTALKHVSVLLNVYLLLVNMFCCFS